MSKLKEQVINSYETGEIVGFKGLTILPTGNVIPLDTGVNGVILSDKGDSSSKVTPIKERKEGKTYIERKFSSLFQDNALTINIGGRGSGKTIATSIATLIETYKEKRNILILRFNKSSVKDSIYSEYIKHIENWDLMDDFDITNNSIENLKTGSKLLFKGIKSSSNDVRDTLKGITDLSTVLIEEAADLDKDFNEVLELLRGTMRTPNRFYRIIITLNPRSKHHTIYKNYVAGLEKENEYCGEYKGAYLINSNYKDNPHLPKQYVDNIELIKKNNPDVYNWVYLGEWKPASQGQIIKRYKTGEYREFTPTVLGVDLGYRDETAALMVSVDNQEMKAYVKLILFASEMTQEDLEVALAPYYDFPLILDSARPEIIAGLKRVNFKARPSIKGAGSVLDGIQRMTSYEIIVDSENSEPVMEAFSRYEWKQGVNEAPNHDFSHIPDAIRYAIMHLTSGASGKYCLDGVVFDKGRDFSTRYAVA